jgi:iron(III) transport system permease protein
VEAAPGAAAPLGGAPTPGPRPGLGGRLLGDRRPPLGLLLAGIAVGLAGVLPAVYLAITLADNPEAAREAIFSGRTLALLGRTLGLAAAVTATAALIAVPLAWLTARTDLPGRRLWATLVTLPLVVPSYIGAYLLVSAFGPRGFLQDALSPLGIEQIPSIYGFPGAWLALTLFTYPLVLLPVRGALMRLDPQLEDAARGLGRSPASVFRTVVLPQLLPAIGAGALLVALYVLSDFGAVSIMRFNSFTREIYIAYGSSFDRTTAAALGAVLVALMLALLAIYGRFRSRAVLHRSTPGTARPPRAVPLGRWKAPALGFCALVVAIALLLPVGVLVYWSSKGIGEVDTATLLANAGNTLLAAGLAAAFAAVAAIVVAVLAVRHRSPVTALIERGGYAGYALPGIVVALALVYFGTRVALPLYQTLAMLVFALAIHYLPLAVGPTSSALLQVSPRVEEAARGLGRGPFGVLRTVTTPLVAGGVFAGTALVFLHAAKELPATLLLAPIGFETLATDVWRQTSVGFFEAGAIPALVLLLIAAPPLFLLSERGTVSS